MSDDTLAPKERAPLLLLMAVGSRVSNNDLKEQFGVTLTGQVNARLKDLKLVETGKAKGHGNTLFHELTDPGWARARQELTGELPTGLWGRSIALSLAARLDSYLDRTGLALADFIVAPAEAADEEGAPADEDVPAAVTDTVPDLETRIRAAYRTLAAKPGDSVSLAQLRPLLADVPREELDEALRELGRNDKATISPQSNRKTLSSEEKAAAVRIGRQQKDLIAIEAV